MPDAGDFSVFHNDVCAKQRVFGCWMGIHSGTLAAGCGMSAVGMVKTPGGRR